MLGIDTATADTAVAVTVDGEVREQRRAGPDEGGRPRHSAVLLGEVEAAVAAAGGWGEIGLIGVGTGPGSYTGLRIGIATARALAQSRELPVAGVSTLEALLGGIGEQPAAAGRRRLAVIDAKRGEVCAQLADPDGVAVWGPAVVAPEAIGAQLGVFDQPTLAAGDGAVRFRQQLEGAGVEVPLDTDPVHRIAARHVCALAAAAGPGRPEQIKPQYLRAPDAAVWLERDRT